MSFHVKLHSNCLIQGVGNPIRQDDGLGYYFIDRIKDKGINADLDWVYQLQIENAEQWSKYDQVIVVDAHVGQQEPIKWTELLPENSIVTDFHQLSSHSITAEAVFYLCRKHFNKIPQVFLLTLRGTQFGIGEDISAEAGRALELAVEALPF